MTEPYMEHPTGGFATSVDAMADAVKRLREERIRDRWITFCAQGMGERPDTYHAAEIRLRNDQLDIDSPIDVEAVTKMAAVPKSALQAQGGYYSIASATPAQAAQVLDAIFRHHMSIQPHEGEDDYAVGAEW